MLVEPGMVRNTKKRATDCGMGQAHMIKTATRRIDTVTSIYAWLESFNLPSPQVDGKVLYVERPSANVPLVYRL